MPRHADFGLIDRAGRLSAVRLVQEIGAPGPLEFHRVDGAWRLSVEVPDVLRMEYLFEVTDRHGTRTITDPANPLRAPGAFGEKSVLEFDGYAAPRWLTAPTVAAGHSDEVELDAPLLQHPVPLSVWSPTQLAQDEPAPLLLVHDGPEFDRLGGFTTYLAASIAAGALPPLRAALLAPTDRDGWYAANDRYARTVAEVVLPWLDHVAPATVRLGVGVSLGALAMLHLQRRHPAALHGLFLQSGSFFTPRLDPQERRFSGVPAVTEFVASVHAAPAAAPATPPDASAVRTDKSAVPTDPSAVPPDPSAVPAVLTCGTVEENRANNEAMAATLRRLGYPTRLVLVRDAHNYVAWRDALDPHLGDLVNDVVFARAA